MEKVFSNFLGDVPRAALIWLALVTLAVIAAAVLDAGRAGPDGWRRVRWAARGRARLVAEAEELGRYADEVAVAAERADATARRTREEWLAAQERADRAWQAYERVETELGRLAAAATLPVPRTPQTPAEYADRERYLHRAAQAACLRGDLSVLDLSDALAHRGGWDPRRHPVEQERVLCQRVRDGLLAAYLAASDQERAAWRANEIAAASARSLRDEVMVAEEQARQARHLVAPPRPVSPALARIRAAVLAYRPRQLSRQLSRRLTRAA